MIADIQLNSALIHKSCVTVKIDDRAWDEGWSWSANGGSSLDNPYRLGSAEAYSWVTGFIAESTLAANCGQVE